jgi:hypothetical protein
LDLCAKGGSGQGTVEWIALIALVALVLGGTAWVAGVRVPGTALARSIAERMVCAVRLAHGCRSDPPLIAGYGPELSELVRAQAPRIDYEDGMTALPVDFRGCRSPSCADGPAGGRVARSLTGRPVVAFTHVVDCRDPAAAEANGYVCDGKRDGRIYVQYWLYYANSSTMRGVPVAGPKGFHLDDWEGYQVRIDPDGGVFARASSHNGYNGGDEIANWASDLGSRDATRAAEDIGLREPGGWTRSGGTLYVSGGSHAGHASEKSLRNELSRLLSAGALSASGQPAPGTLAARDRRYEVARRARGLTEALFGPRSRYTPRGSLKLVPIESLTGREGYAFAITPPWRKRVYFDPEYTGTD